MKKVLVLIIAVVVFNHANAQKIKFGAKAGLNLSNQTGDIEDNKMLTGFHLGAVAEIPLADEYAVQAELVYSTQGRNDEPSGGDKVDFKLDYINLPILFKYYATEAFSIEAGPQIGFLLSATRDGESEGASGAEYKDNIKDIDFGLGLGASYKLEGGMNFSARYNLGLSNINDSDSDANIKNSVIQLSVGYSF